jgi:hypothetical protein
MPESHLRASDADRAAVADALGGHLSAGRLTVAEYDDRLARAYAARTYGELAELTTDLPAAEPRPVAAPTAQPAPAGGCGSGWGHGRGYRSRDVSLRAAWASWASTAVIVVGVWLITSIAAAGLLYPWPLWVIGPWGVVLLARTLGGGRPEGRRRERH